MKFRTFLENPLFAVGFIGRETWRTARPPGTRKPWSCSRWQVLRTGRSARPTFCQLLLIVSSPLRPGRPSRGAPSCARIEWHALRSSRFPIHRFPNPWCFVNWLNTSLGQPPACNFTPDGANDNIALWVPSDGSAKKIPESVPQSERHLFSAQRKRVV